MSYAKLPIGIQDFEKLITNGYTYVDKTPLIHRLITQHLPFFLSRPRRFGKSLLISTLHALFSGKRELFKGLWIDESDWDWTVYPVIRLDMSSLNNESPQLFKDDLMRALSESAAEQDILLSGVSPANYLENFIRKLSAKGKVVVLIDEYDKPLLDRLDNEEIAKAHREILRQFYTILKTEDKHLRFVFLTGVTKFSKVSVFSGLNNLIDLSMLSPYSAFLGYTKEELDKYFWQNIEELSFENHLNITDCYAQIKNWYNGYKFCKEGIPVYNPFSILNLLNSKEFTNHWFETGTPTFLIKLIEKRKFDLINLEQYEISAEDFSTFEIEELPTLPLLYQTGYLTIKSFDPEFHTYRLGFPNREVDQSFNASILRYFATSKGGCS